MIHIACGNDMRQLGIDWLTGEACNYNLRVLCGLTQFGAEVVCSYYGITPAGLREPWNSRACNEAAVASFMLPREMEELRGLCTVGLFMKGCAEVWEPRRKIIAERDPGTLINAKDYREDCPERQWSGVLLGASTEDVKLEESKPWGMLTSRKFVLDASAAEPWEYDDYLRLLRRRTNPGVGRARHAMTGRVE